MDIFKRATRISDIKQRLPKLLSGDPSGTIHHQVFQIDNGKPIPKLEQIKMTQ